LPQSNTNVYPTKGAVVKANFRTRIGYQVLMTLKHGAKSVPFGAIATLITDNRADNMSSIVGDGGQVYLTGLPETGKLLVKWGDAAAQQCQVNFDLRHVDVSADMPIRQVTYPCGTESKAEVVLTTKEPVSFASRIQKLEDLAHEEKPPFSQWTNFR
ncbi:TPA: FimD/PapC C-terminal domain-containing protein, partial [Providencia alcalifaciens]